jgi:beta-RFAP synthase
MVLPPEWRVLLVLDSRGQGLHGKQEVAAFRKLPPFPEHLAARLCHLALMQVLPAAVEGSFELFSEGVAEIQRVVGDHFAPAQGGRFTSPAVASALALATSKGYPGVGQSSWGPTGFIFMPDQCRAECFISDAAQHFGLLSPLQFKIVQPFNQGSSISTEIYAPRIQRTF